MRNTKHLVPALGAARVRIGRWDVVNNAIGSTVRTIRLAVIILASAVPPTALAALVGLLARR